MIMENAIVPRLVRGSDAQTVPVDHRLLIMIVTREFTK
jgi:hypothetical protein